MKTDADPPKIKELLTRGVEKIYPSTEELENLLLSGKKIRLYCGYDPSAATLHLGHAITLKKLGEFQKLGHEVIMLIGDFTGMIGDPTDKSAARKKLSRDEVLKNARSYRKLAGRFLNFVWPNPARIKFNSDWNDKLTFLNLIELSSNFTVQQMIGRDMFQERIKSNKPIYMHEFLYPLAQGYDSVAMNVDLEIGGADQTFNMLVGRDLMRAVKNKEKFVLTMKLLTDPTGKKMGKSEGNMVSMEDSAKEMYGKIMSWPDGIILAAFELLTDMSSEEIEKISSELGNDVNPRDIKAKLAREITAFYRGGNEAVKAGEEFNKIFREQGAPTEMPSFEIKEKELDIVDLLTKVNLAPSRSAAERLVEQKAIKIDGELETDWRKKIPIKSGMIIQAGKRNFAKII